ncbi:C40 family peptidase [Pseudonocardia sp. HH130630-07]|uniref:C40 family peptidase n=1 Tax=Pseudonocardia sp. HH130630-07 TaxID=1690815 RepID=UPI0008151715|nr:C40 family peptidase [Pseudonocardia sp. HH130630-07]ANY08676.1 hypothetical protein AFB00_23135 [Pseudonocardia sp. HH130630-07]
MPETPHRPRARRVRTALGPACLVLAAMLAGTAATSAPRDVPGPTGADDAVVGVSVATVWTSPASPRPRDGAAVSAPADPAGWLGSMTVADRLELTTASRTQTQVLYGTRVRVLERRGDWSLVAVPDQPSAKDGRGYPGWIPAAQLVGDGAFGGLAATLPSGTVDGVATTWLYADADRTERIRELSIGTRLPVRAGTPDSVQVSLPEGGRAWLDARYVRIGGPGADTDGTDDADATTGADLVRTARLFLDRPYLWGGRSGFGPDCSGLTGLVHALHGITIGRDASDQARAGRPVQRDDLQPGDLLFWGSPATHVAIYAGDGTMIEARDAATPVRVAPVRFDEGYSGARRHLPGS